MSTGAIIAIVVGSVMAVCCIGGVIVVALSPGTNTANTADGRTMPTTTDSPAQPPPAARTYHQPTAADFQLTVKILEKSCFGSAGCNVQYRIEVAFIGGELDPSKSYEVTYEVKGAKDTEIGTVKVTGTKYDVRDREYTQTKSSGAELTVVVTGVARQ